MEYVNEKDAIERGMIKIDSDFGKRIGFISDKFFCDSYLWKENNAIYISMIISKYEGQGNLSALFNNISENGYTIKVPTPLGIMVDILKKKNFIKTFESGCEVWVKTI